MGVLPYQWVTMAAVTTTSDIISKRSFSSSSSSSSSSFFSSSFTHLGLVVLVVVYPVSFVVGLLELKPHPLPHGAPNRLVGRLVPCPVH